MSKKQEKAVENALSSEKEQHKRTLKKISVITAIVTVSLILILIISAVIAAYVYNGRTKNGEHLRSETAAVIGETELDAAVMCVLFTDSYQSFAPYLNIDTSLSLKEQYTNDGSTLFELFMKIARTDAESLLIANAAAETEGIALTEAEKTALRNRADKSELSYYPEGISTDDIYDALLLRALAAKYETQKKAQLAPDKLELEARYNESGDIYNYVNMMAFSIYYSDGTDTAAGSVFTESEAAAHADNLAKAHDADTFRSAVRKIILDGSPEMDDETLEEYLSALETPRKAYSKTDELAKWAFSCEFGETYTAVDTNACTYTVYLLTSEPYRDEASTESLRIILLSDTDYANPEATLEKANELAAEFTESRGDIAVFSKLALEFSSDTGSYLTGGVRGNIKSGIMLDALDTWVFSPERKSGDTAVIEITGGCALIYYEDEGLPAWQASVHEDMVHERYDAYFAELALKYPVLFDETVLDMIPG